jgi:hypothetical protein
MVRLVFGGLIGGLIALIAISEYYSLGYTSSIEAVGAILFSGLLVWLYHRQSEILDNQEGLMEQQNRMLMEGHRPQLEFELSGFEPSDDLVSFEVENVGPGTAYDIGFELILEPRKEGYKNLVSYGRVVSEEGNEPASLGVLPSSEKRQMNFQIRLPNPNKDTEQHSLPVSEALSKFDYSHFARPTIFVKTVYSDASGKSCGGTIIEQLAFATEEPLQDVEDLWSYGVNFLGVEDEAWRDLE